MAGSVILFDPTAPRQKEVQPLQRSLGALAGSVVGFIDNAKPNFNYLVDDLAELLVSRYGIREVIKRRKRSASLPAPDEMLNELVEHCDLVITGSGD